jgi:peptidoglycan/xylan/chitin deacetylase (PgdA/CDA1 family)
LARRIPGQALTPVNVIYTKSAWEMKFTWKIIKLFPNLQQSVPSQKILRQLCSRRKSNDWRAGVRLFILKKLKSLLLMVCIFGIGLAVSDCKTINHSGPEFALPPSTVVFSFDDGPNAHDDTTARLLDILKKYEIHAMFVLLGVNAEKYPEMVRRIYDEGHCLINHGYSDKWASKMKEDEFKDNLIKGDVAIYAALESTMGKTQEENPRPKLYRPHGGYYNSKQEQICREMGYTIIPSDVRIYDAVMSSAKQDKAFKKTIEKIIKNNGGIILLHDARDSHYLMEEELIKNPNGPFNRSWVPDMVEKIIIELLDKGFVLGSPALVISNP